MLQIQVLLNLDPAEDPLAGILMVDFYALRARENQWLVNFYNNLEKKRYYYILLK